MLFGGLSKRIPDGEPLFQNLPVRQILGMQDGTLCEQRCRDNHRVVDGKSVALRNLQAEVVRFPGQRFDPAEGPDRRKHFPDIADGHSKFAPGNRAELIEDLDAVSDDSR